MNVILAPIVTEKSVEDMKKGKYAFLITKLTNKKIIKKAVEKSFNVNVVDVATINVKKRQRKTMQGGMLTVPAYKKAVVKIKEGQKIDIFNVEKK